MNKSSKYLGEFATVLWFQAVTNVFDDSYVIPDYVAIRAVHVKNLL